MSTSEREIEIIAASGLFDREWYLTEYPDVKVVGLDPIEHYLRFGGLLLRQPSPNFDTKYYVATNSDVAATQMNPLVHYITLGLAEGRRALPSADTKTEDRHAVPVEARSAQPRLAVVPVRGGAAKRGAARAVEVSTNVVAGEYAANDVAALRPRAEPISRRAVLVTPDQPRLPNYESDLRSEPSAPSLTKPNWATCQRAFSAKVLFADIKTLILTVRGWAKDETYPGLPVRLALDVGGEERYKMLAFSFPTEEDKTSVPEGAYLFKFEYILRERDVACPFRLRFIETSDVLQIALTNKVQVLAASKGFEGRSITPEDIIRGNIESVGNIVSGWALCERNPEAVGLVLYANGKSFAYTKCTKLREDVRERFGGHGYYGFTFELPPNMATFGSLDLLVEPAVGKPLIKNAKNILKPRGIHWHPSRLTTSKRFDVQRSSEGHKSISIIVLNRNGGAILHEMFESAAQVEDISKIEWIIVDHQSTDESEAIICAAVGKGFRVKLLRRHGNFSFSESNNFGARHASGSVLLFANNDLIFCEQFADRILGYFDDPRIGALGSCLLDQIDHADWRNKLPVQHLGVFISTDIQGGWIRPYEARLTAETAIHAEIPVSIPAVTAAFMSMRKEDFEKVGGFDEEYCYGLEDIDLCFNVASRLHKSVICANDIKVIHHRGFSRNLDNDAGIRRRNNNDHFNKKWGTYLRRKVRSQVVRDPAFWTGRRPVVGFIVREAGDNTDAGEYYTAYELGRAMQDVLPVHVRYITEPEWYDLTGIDILIVMVNKFDIMKVKSASPFLISINWTRQWFDKWASDETIYAYDYIWASSQRAADYLSEETGRGIEVMPIATNFGEFSSGNHSLELECDYCFTGSRFGIPREIEYQLDPSSVKGKGIVFGYNWVGTPFEKISKGPVPYSRIKDVYASTRIVIDDGNVATKPWGSCNSRVFDALAAGCLLITNSKLAVSELFGDLMPTFEDRDSLTDTLNYWLTNEPLRKELVNKLQEIARTEHTYSSRARKAVDLLLNRARPLRVAVKCAAITGQKRHWGDFHFAMSLARALRSRDCVVRVDCRESWQSGISDSDDVVIVLRGLLPYKTKPHQKNIMWLISHPNDVPVSEFLGYDYVYLASLPHVEQVCGWSETPIEFLPQCTDKTRFSFDADIIGSRSERVLFVGNSRGIFRDAVRWSVEQELDIDIYGAGWKPFVTDSRLKEQLIPNEVLGEFYASSGIVLCDHWPDMRKMGYVSNRVFDVLASGGRLVVDEVMRMKEVIPYDYEVFRNGEELSEIVKRHVEIKTEARREISEWVLENHSFGARARTIRDRINTLLEIGEMEEQDACGPRLM